MASQDAAGSRAFDGHAQFETLIADISSRFIGVPPGEVDREIDSALRRVCELFGLGLAVLWQWSDAVPVVITPTHVCYVHDGPAPPGTPRQEEYPWIREQMLAGRMVAVSSLDELPAEAAGDREWARVAGIKSSLCLPLSLGGEPPVGALALNTLRTERDWPGEVVRRLQLVTQVLTNALARRRHELNSQESEQRLQLAADSAEAGLWTLDYRTGLFWTTPRARAIFGYSPDDVPDLERLKRSVHPAEWDAVRDAIDRSAHTGEPVDVEYRISRPGTGGERWIASRGRPRLNSAGERDRLMGLSIDITDRKRAEEAVRTSEARLASGTALAGLAFYEVDFGAGVLFADDRFRDLCGIPPDREDLQVLEFWMAHLHPDDRQHLMTVRAQLHGGGLDRASVEYRYLHPVRGELWIHHLAGVAARDAARLAVRTYGVIRDITERRRTENALRASLAKIEELKDRLQAESDYLKAEVRITQAFGELTGGSPAIVKVLRQVEQVAPTDASVLVHGETGTGKELVAQAVHRLSPRGMRLMVKINCAALPSGLIESELFGREKGAFTGALTNQAGRFEVADGSTLFLDEIGELPLDLQTKLLRVLEAGEFERLGSSRTIKVNVRLIAATNRDLPAAIKQGHFRKDLYYRLNVFPIRVPPLRERAEDIPPLVWAFVRELNARFGKKISKVPRTTMEALQRQPWPGNIRELRNVIERAAIVTTGDTLRMPRLEEAPPVAAPPRSLADAEREHILRALERTRWRIKGPDGAAAMLGLNPSTLRGRMKRLDIRPRRNADSDPA